METLEVNGQPAIRINAIEIKRTPYAVYLDCEGDKKWLPLSTVKLEPKTDTVLIQEWKYKQEFL